MKLVVAGNYGASNLGDELILEGLLKTLRTVKPAGKITVLSANPKKVEEKFEVKALYKFPAGIRSFILYLFNGRFGKTRRAVKECDFFILGGGGLFDDASTKAVIIWSIQAMWAYHYKRKVIMYGQSVRKLRSSLAQKLVKRLFRKATFIAVRDEDSKSTLKSLIKGKKVHIMPDLIFKLEPKYTQAKEDKILICPRNAKTLPENFTENLAEAINAYMHKNPEVKVEFIPFKNPEDRAYISEIVSQITEKDRVKKREYTEKRFEVERIFSESRLVIGMRLHSILMAINTGTPFIAINYNPKVRNLLETLDLQKFIIEPENLSENSFQQTTSDPKRLVSARESQVKKHQEIEAHLRTLLN